jgi:hypothetical protein
MKQINFEDNNPLFSEKELHDAISLTAMCITQAVKDNKFDSTEWQDYLIRWNQQHYYPEETLSHINQVIGQSLNALGIHE